MSQFQNVKRRDDPSMHTAEFSALTSSESTRTDEHALPPAALPFSQGMWWVALGGSCGAVCRYILSVLLPTTSTLTLVDLPWGTFLANFLGCLIMGILSGALAVKKDARPELQLAIGTGFCGGFTTMSTFTREVAAMLGARFPLEALQYVLVTFVICIFAVGLGIVAGRWIMNARQARLPAGGVVLEDHADDDPDPAAQIRAAIAAMRSENQASSADADSPMPPDVTVLHPSARKPGEGE